MADNIFGTRFGSLRQPAWHEKGNVWQDEVGAYEGFERIGTIQVWLENLVSESGIQSSHRMVVRGATQDDPVNRQIAVVGGSWVLVTPQDVCSYFDRAVSRPIETIGLLGKGETFFISTKLPVLDVKGDEVQCYMLTVSPMTGQDSIFIRTTPVRVVCQNTLIAAQRASLQKYKIEHDKHAHRRLETWLGGIYTKALEQVETISKDFALMAAKRLDGGQVDRMLELIYTMPNLREVPDDAPDVIKFDQPHADHHAYVLAKTETRREATRQLYQGQGMGMDTQAARGTAWGLYNAAAELMGYETPKRKGRDQDVLMGDRSRVIERAYDVCLAASK
jgi:hypothetical protein